MLVHLLLLLLPWRSYGPASAHATVDVLLFLLCWFQYLATRRVISMLQLLAHPYRLILIQNLEIDPIDLPGMNIINSHLRSS